MHPQGFPTRDSAGCSLEVTSVAPIHINFMMACFTSPDPERRMHTDHWNSPAGLETRRWLLDNGLITEDNRATDRGEAWVRFICETPLPVQVWQRP
jgi:hypothetical protein